MSLCCIYSDHLRAAWDFPLPFSLLRNVFSSLSLSTLLHFHLRSIPSFLFRKKCKGQKVWRGVSRDGKQRELHEVGVMCRITMKGWGVGRSERQMDGEKQHIHLIDASNSSWLRSYLSSRFFSKVLWSSVEVVFSAPFFGFACKDQNYNVCLLSFGHFCNVRWNNSLKTWSRSCSAITKHRLE